MSYSKVSHKLMRDRHIPPKSKIKWWKEDKIYKQVKEFHDAKAREPPGLKEAKHHLSGVIKHLLHYFHGKKPEETREAAQLRKIAKRFEYTGSTYEGLKIPSQETLEFDIMVILDKGVFLNVNNVKMRPAHVMLSPKWRHRPKFRQVLERKMVSPTKAALAFFSQVQICCNEWNKQNEDGEVSIKPVENGPATKLQVSKANQLWYYVDLVPAYEVFKRKEGEKSVSDERQIYVAKPYKGPKPSHLDQFTWRRSFSLKEKELLVNIDKDNGCRKQCIRVLKALKEKESSLEEVICSYHIKTAVLTLCRNEPSLPWRNRDLPARLRDIMNAIATDLDNWKMEHYFLSNYNLFFGVNRKACKNAAKRLKKLADKKYFFLNAFDKDTVSIPQSSPSSQNKVRDAKLKKAKRIRGKDKKEQSKNTDSSHTRHKTTQPNRREHFNRKYKQRNQTTIDMLVNITNEILLKYGTSEASNTQLSKNHESNTASSQNTKNTKTRMKGKQGKASSQPAPQAQRLDPVDDFSLYDYMWDSYSDSLDIDSTIEDFNDPDDDYIDYHDPFDFTDPDDY